MKRKDKQDKKTIKSKTNQKGVQVFFKHTELPLCAALVCAGFPLSHLEPVNSEKFRFVHERKPGLDDVVQRYWQGDLPLDAKSYYYALHSIKSRIYQRKKEVWNGS